MKTYSSKGKYGIKVLQKALNILELFDENRKELSITEINDFLGFNKASTFRIVKNLEDAEYLEKESENGKYKLGLKIYYLGLLAQPHSRIKKLTRPFLERLNAQCDETVHLATLHNGEALYLDKIPSKKTVHVISRVGMKLPAHCSGVGKVLLAGLSEQNLDEVIEEKGLPRLTPSTITNSKTLKIEMKRVRERGYAIDNEEIEEGLKCAAAPLMDANGRVVAAISVSAPKDRFDKDSDVLIRSVVETADEVSNRIQREGLLRDHQV